MKKIDTVLKEYVHKLSDEDLHYLYVRYAQLLCGDRAEIMNYLSRDKELDKILSGAISSEDMFDLIDTIGVFIQKESGRLFSKA